MNAQKFLHTFLILMLVLLGVLDTNAQLRIERKIIIDNGQYYFFTVDDETQLATLYTGSVNQKLNGAKKRLMPIGREFTDQFNPLAFDINGDDLVGVNWILNSMNSRYEAIKRINLKDWTKVRSEWTNEDWGQVSFDMLIAAPNEPWDKMLEENNILENCFFDLIKSNTIKMALCNQGKLWLKEYDGRVWTTRAELKVPFTQYFTLVNRRNDKLGLLDASANYYHFNEKLQELVLIQKANYSKAQLLIEDKDNQKNYLISSEAIESGLFNSLNQLIKASAQELNN